MKDHRPRLALRFLAAGAAANLGAANSENGAPAVQNTNQLLILWLARPLRRYVRVYLDNTRRMNKVGPGRGHELVDALVARADPSEPPVSGIGPLQIYKVGLAGHERSEE